MRKYALPKDLRYTYHHEWARIENDRTVLVGLTDYAFEDTTGVGSRAILHAELPDVGKRIGRAESIAMIETEKNVLEIPSPLTGEILEVNEDLKDDPTLIGSDPYGRGWIVKLRVIDLKQIEGLMDSRKYRKHIDGLS